MAGCSPDAFAYVDLDLLIFPASSHFDFDAHKHPTALGQEFVPRFATRVS
jgi:hypothetical protein